MAPDMSSLPNETLHEICKHLPTSDVANFRLVCRLFGDVGIASLLPVLPLRVKSESLDNLKEVAAHPVLRHHVHSMVFYTDLLPPVPGQWNTFRRLERGVNRPQPQEDGLASQWIGMERPVLDTLLREGQLPQASQTAQTAQGSQAPQAPQGSQTPQAEPNENQTEQQPNRPREPVHVLGRYSIGNPTFPRPHEIPQDYYAEPDEHWIAQQLDLFTHYRDQLMPLIDTASRLMEAHQAEQAPHAELDENQRKQQLAFDGEAKVLEILENGEEFQTALKNLPKLRHLHIKEPELPDPQDAQEPGNQEPPLYLGQLVPATLALGQMRALPPFEVVGQRFLKPLMLALDIVASENTQITSLRIDRMDYGFFMRHGNGGFDRPGFAKLEKLHLGISFLSGAGQTDALVGLMRMPVGSKLGEMVSQLPSLKDMVIIFHDVSSRQALVSTSKLLRPEQIWPGLRRVELSGVEIDPQSFLDFVSSHSQSLTSLSLSDCSLGPKARAHGSQHQSQPPARWSDVLFPLSTELSLNTLTLRGKFWETSREFRSRVPMDKIVLGLDVSIGDLVGMLTCSETIDSFLDKRFRAGALEAKREIFQDLLDPKPRKVSNGRTGYVACIKEFMEQSSGTL